VNKPYIARTVHTALATFICFYAIVTKFTQKIQDWPVQKINVKLTFKIIQDQYFGVSEKATRD